MVDPVNSDPVPVSDCRATATDPFTYNISDGVGGTDMATVTIVETNPSEIFVDENAPADPCPGDPLCSDPAEDGTPEHPFDAIQEAIDKESFLPAPADWWGCDARYCGYASRCPYYRGKVQTGYGGKTDGVGKRTRKAG